MPNIIQTVNGTVTGLWGSALVRSPGGQLHVLKMGDIVHKGDVILTTQDGIVTLTAEPAVPHAAAVDATPEIDRVIADLNRPDSQNAPAAGLTGAEGSGLTPGLRVDRVSEDVTPASFIQNTETLPPAFTDLPATVASQQAQAAAQAAPAPAAPTLAASSSAIAATEEGAAVNLGLAPPSGAGAIGITVQQVPTIGTIVKADGAVVTAGMALQSSDLPGLRYEPPADYNGTDPVGGFRYTATEGSESATGSTAISLAAVNDRPVADSAAVTGAEDAALPISLSGHDVDGTISAVTVTGIPAGSSVFLADGLTPVLAGQTISASQAASLLFKPAPDFNGGTAITFTVTDNDGAISTPATVQINVTPVNDPPVANTGLVSSGMENTAIAVHLGGTDVDGTVTGVTVTSSPANGTLYLHDGVTPVVAGTVLTPAQASDLVFRPDPGFTGPTGIGFTVTDDQGAVSAPASAQVDVTAGPGTLTLVASAASITEGGSVVYSASVDHAVSGSPLVVTLSNGQTITIPVGQSSADSAPFAVRPDDAYAQGTQPLTVGVAGTSGGNYTSLNTAGTVTTSVNDDADASTVTLTASAASVAEGGSIVYTASVNNPVTGSPLVLALSNGQTITIPVGQSSGSSPAFAVRPDDAQVQGNETLTVNIATHSGGNYEALNAAGTATTTVTDNADATTVTLTPSSTTVAEGGSVTYTATLNNAVSGSPLVIALDNGQSITIPVGQSSGSTAPFAVRADDAYVQGTQTLTVAVGSTSGGNFEALTHTGTASTTVTDNGDATTVSLTASASNVTEGGSVIYTAALSNPVTGSPLVIALSNGQTITIPVGQSSGDSAPFQVRPDDVYAQGTQALTVAVASTNGGNFEAVTATGSATTAVADDADATTVTITASAAAVTEGGSIVYTATVNNPVTDSALVVTLSNGQTITIPVGQSSADSAPFVVRADDAYVQGTQTLSVGISATAGGHYEALTPTGPVSTTVTDNADGTTVSLSASSASVAEGGNIVYTASVNNPVSGSPLVVTLSNGQSITIPVGQSSADGAPFAVRPDDAYAQGTQTLTVSVALTSGGNYEAIVASGTATTTVTDDADATTVTLTASAPSVVEGGSIVYTATLSNAVTGTPLVVTLDNGQTITIPVGQSSASSAPFAVRPDDANVQGTETLSVGVASTSGANFEAVVHTGTAVTTVTDNASATSVSLSASTASVSEGGSIVYTATLNNTVSGSPLVIALDNGQSITIPIGQSSGSTAPFAVRADDAYVQGTQTLTVAVGSTSGGNFEALTHTGTVTTTVVDDADPTTVTLSASAASVTEGGSIIYTASVDHAVTAAPLVISLSNGQTITIPVGQSSADSTPFAVRADDAYVQGTQTVSVGITGTSGGNYEALATTSTASTTVHDDSDTTSLTLSASPSVAEGGSIVYTASLSAAAQTAMTVTLSNGAVIQIAAGDSSGTVSHPAPANDVYLNAGSVSATVASASGGNFENLSVNPAAATTAVTDTIDTTTVSITGSASVNEGATASYAVSLTSPAHADVTVTLSYSGTATDGSDFTGVATVTIPSGASSANFSIATIDDTLAEGAESFTVAIASATGGNFENLAVSGAAGSVSTGIVDNDIAGVASVSDAHALEGSSIVHTVTLASASATPTTYSLSLADVTATGGGVDYASTLTNAAFSNGVTISGGVVTVPAGVTSFTVAVPTTADAINEPSETYHLSVGGVTATGTIDDNNATPALSINSVSVNEDAGTATFTVTLSAVSGQQVTVGYNTSNGTATAGSDYTAASGTLTFAPGETTKIVTVAITNDTTAEPTETFNVTLAAPTNATLAAAVGVGSIIDNDAPPAVDLDADNSSATGTGYTTTYTENGTGVAIADADIRITDVDSTHLVSATITLTNAQAGDMLAAGTMPAGITATVAGNVVTLTGSATLASYQTAIQAITYASTSEDPNTSDRLINVVVNDGTSNSAAAVATVHLVAVNDAAVITPAVANLTETNAVLTTGGTLAISDVDSAATFVVQSNVAGSNGYGTFTLGANGAWTYVTSTAHNEFVAGQTYTDKLTVTSADGTTSTITVNILGTNDAAVITPAIVNLTETDAVLSTSGTLAITDVDSAATFVAQSNVAGSNGYGTFTLGANGAWTYVTSTAHNEFVAGQTYTDKLTVTSADGTTSTITVNILGTNDAAVITPAIVNLTETDAVLTTGGTLTITDVDSPATFVAQSNVAGSNGYGSFTLGTNGAWTYVTSTAHNEFVAGQTYTDKLTVTSADGTTSTITVNILGTNDAAVITPAVVNLTETDAVLTTSGTLTITDVDSPATFVAQSNVAGSNGYGSFTLGTNGAWTYTANTAHNEFVAGTTYTDTLTVASADGTTSTITVNILGTNDAAVITPAVVNLTETNAVLTTGGTLAISDVDSAASFVAQSNVAGSNGYGTFTLGANGAWTYTANTAHNEFVAGQTYTDTLTVTSADGTTSTITVNILGTNDAAVITPAVVNLTETNAVLTTGGTLAISDVDSAATFVAQSNVAGSNGYGSFTLGTNGAWTYTANTAHNEFVAGQTYTDKLTVTSADGTTSTITVNILGTNDAAVITPAVVNLTETNAVLTTGGTLSISDVDSPATFVAQSNVAGSNGYGTFTLGTNGAWTYVTSTAHNEFVAGQTYTDTLTVASADGTTSTITVNILGTNDAAVITPAIVNLTETDAVLTTGGTLAISDVDSPATFVAQSNVAGSNGYGTFTLGANGAWTYTANTAHNEFVAGQTYTDKLTITSADGTTSTITVNILGTNDAAVITPAVVNLTETNAVLTTGGTLSISDVDSPATFVAQSNVAGSNGYGTFTLGANGAWTYVTSTAHNEFVAGQTYTDTLTVASADGTTSTITVNILGTNDAALITPAIVNLTETDAVLTTGGTLTITDVDSPATFVAQSNVAGSNGYGSFTLGTNGAWTYVTSTAHNEFVAGQTYTDKLTVTSADGTTSTITVNILGTNDAAVITPAVVNLTETNAVLTTGGTLAISDVDSAATFVAQSNVAGSNGYGSFTLGTNGAWTYTANTAHNEFVAGQTYTDKLTVTSADGTTSTITVNILGTNDAAVITPAVVNLTETNAVLTTGGTLSISDVDSPATFVAQSNVAGSNGYGTFTLGTNGAWTYVTSTAHNEFVAGQTYTDTLTVASADGTTSTITVNILGTNDAAVITPAIVNLTETDAVLTTGGTLAISDVDSPATFVAQSNVAGSNGYGTFTLGANGAWTYTANTAHNEFVAGQTYTDKLTITSADGTTSTITVNILGTNDAAVITPAVVNLTETNAVLTTGGTLSISDVDSPATFVAQSNVAGSNGYGTFTLGANGAWTYVTSTAHNEFVAGQTYTDTLTVASADGTTSTITVNILGTNDAALITPAIVNLTETDAVLTTGGTLTITDVDSPATFVAQSNVAGSNGYGTFTLGTNGAWTYVTSTAHNEFVVGQTYTDKLTVTSADGTTSTITVNILGTNDAAVITPAIVNLTETDAVLTTGGTLAISDVDSAATFVVQSNVAGSNGYGTFTLGTNGAWTYTANTAHNEFVAGTTYTDTLTVASADGTTSTITVNILGTNDAAVITPAVVNLTETNAVLTTGGTLAISDVDSAATFVAQSNVAGSNGYGSFTLGTNGAWTYTANTAHNEFVAGQTYTDTLTVTSADGTTSTITVNILGTNDAAVITPAVVNLTETNAVLTTGGTLSISDVDSPATFVAQSNVAGSNGYGTFTLGTNGAWTYTANTAHNEFVAGQTYTDKLTVTSADGTTSTITVNILGTNDAAVITPAVVNLTETDAVLTTGGTLSISDVDSPATFVAQSNVAGSNGYGTFTLGTNGVWTYTANTAHNEFVAGTTYTDKLTVTSADGTTSTITVNILGTNDAPIATGSAITGIEDIPLAITWANLGVTDADTAASSLTIKVATLPADGFLQTYNGTSWVNVTAGQVITKALIDAGSFRFIPDANESGADAYGGSGVGNEQADYARFTFTPNDGTADGATATMRIDITPVADAPTETHNASAQVVGTLSTLTSVGLTRDYYNAIPTLASGASSTNPDIGEAGIKAAVPTSSSLVTNVGVAGNIANDTGVQVAADDAYHVKGLIYMEAGKSYVFSGYADDTVRLEVGGTALMSGQWGVAGQASSGTFTSSTFTPTTTGYYSLEFFVYNTSGPGSYDLNLSVNGATAVDVSTANFYLYQSINQVDATGGQHNVFVPNTTTNLGGYYPVLNDASVQSKVYLAPIVAGLTDSDGSETLAVQIQSIPVGAVLSDNNSHSFTATAANTSVDVSGWTLAHLAITMPTGFSGTSSLTAVATSTETANGDHATTSITIPITVDPTGTSASLAEAGTFNGDALIGHTGNDQFVVSGGDTGTGLSVAITQGAYSTIAAQTGNETTATTAQVFATGAGNDYVDAGAGNDTIYFGVSSGNHPTTGVAPTTTDILATQLMTLADSSVTQANGLLSTAAMQTSSSSSALVTTWANVGNGGSGNDAIYGNNGTDLLYGSSGNDYIKGGAGNDGLRGGAGNDVLVGGAGNDVLRGDAGADVFRWEFGDQGTTSKPAADIIMDFNTAAPSAGGDVLDLRDLLQGEATVGGAAGNLGNYLHFTVSAGSTTIQISSSGGYSGGFAAGKTDQSILLQGVDLSASGTLSTDQQIINDLLTKSKLLVDGT